MLPDLEQGDSLRFGGNSIVHSIAYGSGNARQRCHPCARRRGVQEEDTIDKAIKTAAERHGFRKVWWKRVATRIWPT